MSRGRAVIWAALVLGLLVLPPALSAAQEAAEPVPAQSGEAQTGPAPPPGADEAGGPSEDPQTEPAGGGETGAEPATQPAAEAQSGPRAKASEPTARFASSLTVSIGDNFYSPRSVSIDVGDTVTWVNNGQAQHSATASDGSFDTGIFGPGGSRSHTFNQAGSFDYFCTVHGSAQSGTLTVASASAAGGGGSGGGGSGGGGGPSEASAVSSAGAAGDSSTLPATGDEVLLPLAVGLALLFAGFALRLRARA
jgi:plastocyanin